MSKLVHKPVLCSEVLDALSPRSGGVYADGTVGAGGHASAILKASAPDGWLYGCDRDKSAIQIATDRLAEFAGRFELRAASFAELAEWIGPGRCDGVLVDLGVSSMQLDNPERGFSFQSDGPLDMRMDQRQSQTAADVVNEARVDELARIFWEFGGERQSNRLARAIAEGRTHCRIESTRQLASLIERTVHSKGQKIHPATRVFQALRISVNDELGQLRAGLHSAWTILKPGGRLAAIVFHSLEDRIVKEFGRKLARDYTVEGAVDIPELRQPKPSELRWVRKKAIHPTENEISANPRARSAQLRVMEKV